MNFVFALLTASTLFAQGKADLVKSQDTYRAYTFLLKTASGEVAQGKSILTVRVVGDLMTDCHVEAVTAQFLNPESMTSYPRWYRPQNKFLVDIEVKKNALENFCPAKKTPFASPVSEILNEGSTATFVVPDGLTVVIENVAPSAGRAELAQ